MHEQRFSKRLFLLCCFLLIPAGAWGDHPVKVRPAPQTPAQEQARQLAAMGTKYLYQDDYRQAAKAFQAATQLDPQDAEAYFSWGFALGALGQRQEEIKKYELAVRCDPAFGEAYVAWALALVQLGRQEEAKAKVSEALAVAPEAITPMQLMVLKALDLLE